MAKVSFIIPPVKDKFKIFGNTVYKKGDQFLICRNSSAGSNVVYQLRLPSLSIAMAAALFPGFTLDQIAKWLAYQNNQGIGKSALNAAVKNNIQKNYHFLPGLDPVIDISIPAQHPDLPTCIYAYYDEDIDCVGFEWNNIYEDETYIAFGVTRSKFFASDKSVKWKISGAEFAAMEYYPLPGFHFIAGRKNYVSLRACNTRGEVSAWAPGMEIDIPDKPKPNFYAIPVEGSAPLNVQFYNTSENFIKGYLWDFGDGAQSGVENPAHIYDDILDKYTVSLTCFGAANSKKTKTRLNYIKIEKEELLWLMICDYSNHRICVWDALTFSHIKNFGSYGIGDGQFNRPWGCCFDPWTNEFFVSEDWGRRVQVFNFPDFDFLRKVGSRGTGPDQFNYANGIDVDENFVYIADKSNHRVHVRNKSDLSLHYMFNDPGVAPYRFYYPVGIAVDDLYLYITDQNFRVLTVWNKNDFTPVYYINSGNASGWTPHYMPYLRVDKNLLYLVNYYTITTHLYCLPIGSLAPLYDIDLTQATSDPNTRGVANYFPFAFCSNYQSNLIQHINIQDEIILETFGSYGSDPNQFNRPLGCCLNLKHGF